MGTGWDDSQFPAAAEVTMWQSPAVSVQLFAPSQVCSGGGLKKEMPATDSADRLIINPG